MRYFDQFESYFCYFQIRYAQTEQPYLISSISGEEW